MRNQVLEFNLGSIDEIGIFGDWFEFLDQLCEIVSQIEQIESLTVGWGLNHAHQKPRTKIKKSRKAKFEIKFLWDIIA